ncbi:MAG: tetratricopeptide (TPR) repeat protein [Hyphomicrobiaceae bacterium]
MFGCSALGTATQELEPTLPNGNSTENGPRYMGPRHTGRQHTARHHTGSACQALAIRACLRVLENQRRLDRVIELAPAMLQNTNDPITRGRVELATAEALLVTGSQALALAAFERALTVLRGVAGCEAAEIRIRALDELTAWDETERAERLRVRLNAEIAHFFSIAGPNDETAWVWLAVSRLACERGDLVEAATAARRSADSAFDARVRDAARIQGVICLRQARKFDEAATMANGVLGRVESARARAELYVQLGHALYDAEKLDEAEAAYRAAMEAARADGDLARDIDFLGSMEAWLANVDCDRGQLDAAEARARDLVQASWRDGESHVEGLLVLARCATERGQFIEARSIYREGLARQAGRTFLKQPLCNGLAHVYYLEALAVYEQDRFPEAVPLLRSATDLADPSSPTYAWAELTLAYSFEALGKPLVARAHYETVSRAPGATNEDLAAAYEFLMETPDISGTA